MNTSIARADTPRWLANLFDLRQRARWSVLMRIYIRRTHIIGRGPRSTTWMQAALRRWRLITPTMAARTGPR
jgi:hypothetical protein